MKGLVRFGSVFIAGAGSGSTGSAFYLKIITKIDNSIKFICSRSNLSLYSWDQTFDNGFWLLGDFKGWINKRLWRFYL